MSGTVSRVMSTLKQGLKDQLPGSQTDADGNSLTLSRMMGHPVQAHHCISCSVIAQMNNGDMARLAVDSGYDVNNGGNGIALPAYFGDMRHNNKQRHRGGHAESYYKAVKKKLDPIYDDFAGTDPCNDETAKKNILGALKAVEAEIKSELEAPSLWLYEWSKSLYNGDYRDEGATDLDSDRPREPSSETGLQWLTNYTVGVKRRHAFVDQQPVVLATLYAEQGYPVPGDVI